MRRYYTVIFILLLAAIAFVIDIPKSLPIHINTPFLKINHDFTRPAIDYRISSFRFQDIDPHLGLDLQGGAYLVFEADVKNLSEADKDNALNSAKSVIERRVNLFGTTEPVVQTAKVGDSRRIIVEIPGVSDVNEAINLIGKTAQLSFWEEDTATPSGQPSENYPFTKPTELSGKDLVRAQVSFNQQSGSPQVNLDFNDSGRQKFADITTRNIQKRVAITLDGQIVTAPVVQQAITDGSAVITGNFTIDQAKSLSIQLNAGALPVPIKVVEQRQVGATLGAESIQKSIVAAIIGVTIVMLFMAIYYGIPGILADIALIIYTLLTLALFKVIPVTLTLAGIAGFILSIGMAVDANILIFERMKEEMRWGKRRIPAIEAGFSRAWTSIRDSNSSSLITCFILFIFGEGVVRGFAVALGIGIIVSMFSAIFVTRTFLRIIYKDSK